MGPLSGCLAGGPTHRSYAARSYAVVHQDGALSANDLSGALELSAPTFQEPGHGASDRQMVGTGLTSRPWGDVDDGGSSADSRNTAGGVHRSPSNPQETGRQMVGGAGGCGWTRATNSGGSSRSFVWFFPFPDTTQSTGLPVRTAFKTARGGARGVNVGGIPREVERPELTFGPHSGTYIDGRP